MVAKALWSGKVAGLPLSESQLSDLNGLNLS